MFSLFYLENSNFLQSFQVNKQSNLPLEFARHHVHNVLLLQGSFVRPEIVEPLKNSLLDISGHFPEDHVLLDGVHLVLVVRPGGVHILYHSANITNNRGDYQHSCK